MHAPVVTVEPTSEPTTRIATVSIKLPPFGPLTRKYGSPRWRQPSLLDGLLFRRPVLTMSSHPYLQKLPRRYATSFSSPPVTSPYTALKEQLIRYRSNAVTVPSLLQRLPPNVRMVLASSSTTATLEEIEELADKVVELATPTVTATSAPRLS